MSEQDNSHATVVLTGALTVLFPGAPKRLALEGETVEQLLLALDRRWPGMRDRLRDTSPAIRKHINIFINGERAVLETPIPPGSQVYILTAMSGG